MGKLIQIHKPDPNKRMGGIKMKLGTRKMVNPEFIPETTLVYNCRSLSPSDLVIEKYINHLRDVSNELNIAIKKSRLSVENARGIKKPHK